MDNSGINTGVTRDYTDMLMTCSLGETSSRLRVSFKKTVKVREYETEVIEATNELDVDERLTGMERAFIAEILKCQMEYTVYIDLLERGVVTRSEYMEKREQINETVKIMVQRATELNIDVSKYLAP